MRGVLSIIKLFGGIALCVLLLLISSCDVNKFNDSKISKSVIIDSFFVPFDSMEINSIDFIHQSSNRLYICHPEISRVTMVDINTLEKKTIQLDSTIGKCYGLMMLCEASDNNLLIEVSGNVFLIDSTGKILKTIIRSDWETDPKCYMSHIFETALHFDKQNGYMYIRAIYDTVFKDPLAITQYPIEGKCNIADSQIQDLDIYYPNIYKRNYFGFLKNYSRTLVDSTLVYSFNADNYLYTYNIYTGQKENYKIDNPYRYREVKPANIKKKSNSQYLYDHFSEEPRYHWLLYDHFSKNYYLTYFNEFKIENEDGTYNSLADRQIIILEIDSNFKTKRFIEPPQNHIKIFPLIFGTKGIIGREHLPQGIKFYVFNSI